MNKVFTQKRRAYLYRVALAAGGVAVFYGIITADELVVWSGAIATVLMVLPAANTPTGSE